MLHQTRDHVPLKDKCWILPDLLDSLCSLLEVTVSPKKTILLIDDDPLVCEMTQGVLGRLGYNSIVNMSAREARETFSNSPWQFDLIMVDLLLPDGNGIELAQGLLGIRSDVPIVLYTGRVVELEDIRAKGICAVASKGLSRGELGIVIKQALEQEGNSREEIRSGTERAPSEGAR